MSSPPACSNGHHIKLTEEASVALVWSLVLPRPSSTLQFTSYLAPIPRANLWSHNLAGAGCQQIGVLGLAITVLLYDGLGKACMQYFQHVCLCISCCPLRGLDVGWLSDHARGPARALDIVSIMMNYDVASCVLYLILLLHVCESQTTLTTGDNTYVIPVRHLRERCAPVASLPTHFRHIGYRRVDTSVQLNLSYSTR